MSHQKPLMEINSLCPQEHSNNAIQLTVPKNK